MPTVFPKFQGQGWTVQKTPTWNNIVQQSVAGHEVRISFWTVPLWEFTLKYDFVAAQQSYRYGGTVPVASTIITAVPLVANDYAAICGFYMARGGKFDNWLFDDPTDHATVQDVIGQSNGTSTNYQASRQLGEFIEPIGNLNGSPIIASLWQPNTAVASGALALPSITGARYRGSRLAISWQTPGWPCYYSGTVGTTGPIEPNWDFARVQGMQIQDGNVTWTNQGVGQIVYVEQSLPDWTTGSHAANSAILPTSNNAGGFTYVATVGGASGGSRPNPFNQSLGGPTTDGGVTWVNYGVSLGGIGNPVVPQLPSAWSVNSTGLITLNSPPPAGNYVRLTSGFYFLCRFLEDRLSFEEFNHRLYRLGKFSFTSIKGPPLIPQQVSTVSQRNGSVSVAANAFNAGVTFTDVGTTNYAISMDPNWDATAWWTAKSSNGFTANFSTPAPSDGSGVLDWSVSLN